MDPDYERNEVNEETEASAPARATAFVILILVLALALTGLCALLVTLTAVIVYGNFILVTLLGIAFRLGLLYNPE